MRDALKTTFVAGLLCLGFSRLTVAEVTSSCPNSPVLDVFKPFNEAEVSKELKTAPRLFSLLSGSQRKRLIHALEAGDDPNVCAMGVSLLGWGIHIGDVEVVRLLLDHGANPDYPTMVTGQTPLEVALGIGHFEHAELLLDRGALVKHIDQAGLNPLQQLAMAIGAANTWQSSSTQLRLAQRLPKAGDNINQQSKHGTTALMWAAINGNQPLVEFLLAYGADPTLRNTKDETALSFAERKGYADIANRLRRAMSTAAAQ